MNSDTLRDNDSEPVSRRVVIYALIMQALAGLLGAAGVALAAAAAHKGGGDLTALAATFAILHAGAVVAIAGTVIGRPRLGWGPLVPATAMILGTLLFCGDLALIGLAGARPWPLAAPIGGSVMILAWLAVAILAVVRIFRV